jgi:hypothetical protein
MIASQMDDEDAIEDTDMLSGDEILLAISKVRFKCLTIDFSNLMVSFIYLQLRTIVRSVRSSPQRRQGWMRELRAVHDDDEAPPALMLILDVKTRWSSTHQMLRESMHTSSSSLS